MMYNQGTVKTVRLLLIEDSLTDQRLFQLTVRAAKWPIQIKVARHGKEAIEILKRLPARQWPHMIITDLKMPIMNGFAFLEAYSSTFRKNRNRHPVIYVTSSTICRDEVRRAQSHPLVRDFVPKPLVKETLQRLFGPIAQPAAPTRAKRRMRMF